MDYCKEEKRAKGNYYVIKIPRLSFVMQKYKFKLLGAILCSAGVVAVAMLPEDAMAGVIAILMGIAVIAKM